MTKKSVSSIVVAVDFGTTFSGVAWAQTANPDAHYIINQWPQGSSGSFEGATSDKVPSDIAYQQGPSGKPEHLWGFQIPDSMPRMQWIKLGLAPDQTPGVSSRLSSAYNDGRRAPPPYNISEEDAVTDYLRSLRRHAVNVLGSKVGRAFDSMPLEFVITVPAMWSEKAKVATLACAERAGLGDTSKIRIISEPEAAAMHAIHASSPNGLEVGDTIVLCDAGGGTVDLITYSIVEVKPNLVLKEEAPGNGGLCGSTFLNRRFEDFLKKRLSSFPGWDRDTLEEALHRFETVAKRNFSGNIYDDFHFPVPGIANNEKTGVYRGRLQVTGQEMKSLFAPVLQEVQDLVYGQIQASKKKVKAIFLVGGFGQSPYLRSYLRNTFSPEIEVLAPANGWTAVVRGALIKTLGEISPHALTASVESRVARKNYGISMSVKYIEGKHDKTRRFWDPFDGNYRISVMDWLIQKGDAIKESCPIVVGLFRRQKTCSGQFDRINVTIYELDTPEVGCAPLYPNDRMKEHANLDPRLDRILKTHIPVRRGRDGYDYYEPEYQVQAAFFSAHSEYTLWFEGKNHEGEEEGFNLDLEGCLERCCSIVAPTLDYII